MSLLGIMEYAKRNEREKEVRSALDANNAYTDSELARAREEKTVAEWQKKAAEDYANGVVHQPGISALPTAQLTPDEEQSVRARVDPENRRRMYRALENYYVNNPEKLLAVQQAARQDAFRESVAYDLKGLQNGDVGVMRKMIKFADPYMTNGTYSVTDDGKVQQLDAQGKPVGSPFVPTQQQLTDAFNQYVALRQLQEFGDVSQFYKNQESALGLTNTRRDQAKEEWKTLDDSRRAWYTLAANDRNTQYNPVVLSSSQSESVGAQGTGKGSTSGTGTSGVLYQDKTDEMGEPQRVIVDAKTKKPLAQVSSTDGSLRPVYMSKEQFKAACEKIESEGYAPGMDYNPSTGQYELTASVQKGGDTLVRFWGTNDWVNVKDIQNPYQATAQGIPVGGGGSARSHSRYYSGSYVVRPNEGLVRYGYPSGMPTAAEVLTSMGPNPYPFASAQPQGRSQAIPAPQHTPATQSPASMPVPLAPRPAPAPMPAAQAQPAAAPTTQASQPATTPAPQPQNQAPEPAAQAPASAPAQTQAQPPALQEKEEPAEAAQAIPTESDNEESDNGKSGINQFGRWLAEHVGSADKDNELNQTLKDLPSIVGKVFSDAVARSKEYAEVRSNQVEKIWDSVDKRWGISKGVNAAKQKFDEVTDAAEQKFDAATKRRAAEVSNPSQVGEKLTAAVDYIAEGAKEVPEFGRKAIETIEQSMSEATRSRAEEVESSKLNQAIIDQRDRMSANAERMGNMGRRALDDIKTIAKGAAEPVAEYAGKVGEKAKRVGRMAGQAADDVKTIAKNASKRRAQEASKPSKLNQAIKDKKERVEDNAKRMGDMGRRLVENVKAAGKKFAEDNSVRIEPRQTEEAPAALYGQRVRKNAEKTAAMGRRALDELGDFGKKTKEDLKAAGKKFAEDNAVRVEPRQTEEAPAALYGLQARKGAEKMAGVGRRALDDLRDFGKKTEEDLKAAGKRFAEDNTVRIKPRQEPETAATRYGKKVGDKAKRMGEMGRRAVEDAKTIAKPAAAYAEQVGKKAERMGAMGRRAAEDVGTIVKNAVTEETSAGRAGRAYGKRVKENAGRMGNMGRRAVEDLKKISGNLSESMSRTYDDILRRIIGAVDPEQDDGSLDEVMEQLSGVLEKGTEREAIPTAKGASKNRRSYAVEDDRAYAALGNAILKYLSSQSRVA